MLTLKEARKKGREHIQKYKCRYCYICFRKDCGFYISSMVDSYAVFDLYAGGELKEITYTEHARRFHQERKRRRR